MRLDEADQPAVDLLPDLVRHHRLERRARHLDREVHLALVTLIHNHARAARQKPGNFFNRLLGSGKTDALQLAAADMVEALERQREMRAAARLEHGMDLVDDHHAGALEHRPRALGGEQEVKRLRRGHQDMRRRAQHRRALALRRIPAADRRSDLDRRIAHRLGESADLAPRLGQVLVDVRRKRLQRRDIDDAHLVREVFFKPFSKEVVDRGQERGERLPRTGGRRDERVLAAPDGAPAFGLGVGGLAEAAVPPALQYGVKILG